MLGPPLGGLIVTYGSWRWIFFLNLPIALVGVMLVTRFIKDVKEERSHPLDWTGLVLTGVGMAGVVYGFDNLGRGLLSNAMVAAMMVGGAICLLLYWRHAARVEHAILDLDLLRIPTFTASVIGGSFMRMGIGATPFLLALLLQVAFGLSALQAGLMTFASAAAALVMKTAAPPILARFGFRATLIVNAVIVAVSFMAYGLFRSATPLWVIYAVLLAGGFFRSLQFTSLNGMAFADVDHCPDESRVDPIDHGPTGLAKRRCGNGGSALATVPRARQHDPTDSVDHRAGLRGDRACVPDLAGVFSAAAAKCWRGASRFAADPVRARPALVEPLRLIGKVGVGPPGRAPPSPRCGNRGLQGVRAAPAFTCRAA